MSSPLFQVEEDGEVLIVTPLRNVGSLAEENVPQELQQITARFDADARHLLLDFSRVAYFGSSMLEGVLSFGKHVQAKGGRLVLAGVSPTGQEILRISRFDTLWPAYADRSAALAALRAAPAGPAPVARP